MVRRTTPVPVTQRQRSKFDKRRIKSPIWVWKCKERDAFQRINISLSNNPLLEAQRLFGRIHSLSVLSGYGIVTVLAQIQEIPNQKENN